MPSPRGSVAAVAEIAERLEAISVEVAQRAADHVRLSLGSATTIATKSTPTDAVTATDLEVEALICEELLAATPDASIVGEEGTAIKGTSEVEWVIDPIDGTINFLYDLPVVAVSIAASVDGMVVAGAIADVLRNELFSAHLGGGARLDGQPVSVSSVSALERALVATGFSYVAERRKEEAETVRRILPAARDIRCFGSAALHLAWVGCGRVDAYWEGDTNHWDVAAGRLIAEEGGAVVESESSGGSGAVLAASPGIADGLRELVFG